MVQRVAYNSCFGGFSVREDVAYWVRENRDDLEAEYDEDDVAEIAEATLSGEMYSDGSGPKEDFFDDFGAFDLSRDNELLCDVITNEVEYSGPVDGTHARLRVAEVPDDVEWTIDEYDGNETVKEQSQTFS